MLLERANSLADKVAKYQKLKIAANTAEALRTRANQVGQAAALVRGAKAALDSFKSADVPVVFVPSNSNALLEKAIILKGIAEQDPAGITELPFNFKYDFSDRLIGIATAASTALAEGWRNYVTTHAPSGSEEVLDALAKVPQLRAGVGRIRQCRQSIEALAQTCPTNPASARSELTRLATQYQAAWAELTADGIPRPVILFIRACAGPGATVGSLTDEVRDWLQGRGLIDAFRIRIG